MFLHKYIQTRGYVNGERANSEAPGGGEAKGSGGDSVGRSRICSEPVAKQTAERDAKRSGCGVAVLRFYRNFFGSAVWRFYGLRCTGFAMLRLHGFAGLAVLQAWGLLRCCGFAGLRVLRYCFVAVLQTLEVLR